MFVPLQTKMNENRDGGKKEETGENLSPSTPDVVQLWLKDGSLEVA
jgi:hypothetical protein